MRQIERRIDFETFFAEAPAMHPNSSLIKGAVGGGPDEDRDGGFEHGGWTSRYDEQMNRLGEIEAIVGEWESKTDALLLGRRTYEIFAGSWGVRDENAEGQQGELTKRYNRIPKYVASRTLTRLAWQTANLATRRRPMACFAAFRPRLDQRWSTCT